VSIQAQAMQPEDVTRLVAERLNAGDAAGVAALYEPQAVLAYPADRPVTGREAIQAIYQQMADAGVRFAIETPLPTVRFEDLALTSTRSADNTGVRVQVLRRQPDGSWLRIIDRPEVPAAVTSGGLPPRHCRITIRGSGAGCEQRCVIGPCLDSARIAAVLHADRCVTA
jgi:ketosteroid isomerase-like protein